MIAADWVARADATAAEAKVYLCRQLLRVFAWCPAEDGDLESINWFDDHMLRAMERRITTAVHANTAVLAAALYNFKDCASNCTHADFCLAAKANYLAAVAPADSFLYQEALKTRAWLMKAADEVADHDLDAWNEAFDLETERVWGEQLSSLPTHPTAHEYAQLTLSAARTHGAADLAWKEWGTPSVCTMDGWPCCSKGHAFHIGFVLGSSAVHCDGPCQAVEFHIGKLYGIASTATLIYAPTAQDTAMIPLDTKEWHTRSR